MTKQLGSAGESGSNIDDATKYLVKGYVPTIGIECHVQLNTATKLFSTVDNDAREAEPNSKVSAVDYALPGMLPYLNKEAIRLAARAGKALGSDIAHESRFDRKHYFYPDLPSGYQISQMYQPIILGGKVELPSGITVRIHHAHLEADAGKLTHFSDYSLVDLNRAGTPLIEIVGEPDIHSAAEAREYAEELHGLMTFAGVTNGDLYYGNMRFDVNVSVAKPGEKLGKRTEIKNLNSFRSVEKAAEYEILRQIELIEKGEEIVQETRGWSDATGKTTSQRGKENAQDYRYMPDPDIPPVVLTDDDIASMQEDMPPLPPELRQKWSTLNLDKSVVDMMLQNVDVANMLNSIFAEGLPRAKAEIVAEAAEDAGWGEISLSDYDKLVKRIFNWFASIPWEELKLEYLDGRIGPRWLLGLSKLTEDNKLSSTGAKEVFIAGFTEEWKPGRMPEEIAKAKNLLQVSDESAISKIVDDVLADPTSAKAVEDFKNGNEKVIGFLVGQVMKASKGQANPGLAQKLIREKLL
jgi:aspartyl-tRNA(Asn)/glutamyl-tRNA(Gln) amidotransferase subunit B